MKTTLPTSLLLALAIGTSLPASAQSVSQLQQENAQLRAQIAALQAQGCAAPSTAESTWSDAQLSARVESIRVGTRSNDRNTTEISVALTLTNTGNTPLPLNYEYGSFSLTDNRGYRYELSLSSESTHVKGIPVATSSRADARQPLMPGRSSTVTFLTSRKMRDGQTPGDSFDINTTFGAYQDEGQGRIRKLRTYPVAFTNVHRSTAGYTGDQSGQNLPTEVGEKVIDRLVDGLFKGRK